MSPAAQVHSLALKKVTGKEKSKAGSRVLRAERSNEQTDFLLRLWAENYDFINIVHARKH